MKNALKDIHIQEFNAKGVLSQIAKINARLKAEIKQLDELQCFKASLSGLDYSKPFIANNNVSDSVSCSVVKLIDLELDIKRDIYDYTKKKKNIIQD